MCVYVDATADSLPGDLICGALISLIHKQHMDGGVEEYGERMAENWWQRDGQTKRTPLLLPFAPRLAAHNAYALTHPSILPPGYVEDQNGAKPAGRRRRLPNSHVCSRRPTKRFPGRRSSQTVARQYGQLNITVRA